MKTLPSIPKSIPSHICAEAKVKGLVYVGIGNESTPIFPTHVDAFVWEKGHDSLFEERVEGNAPAWHYFVAPTVAKRYFTIPKKTTQVLTRGAKGRFISPKPVPVVKYPDVKNVEHRPLGLAHSIEHCDKVLNGDMEALFHAFTWASAAPAGKNFQYWYEPNRGDRPLSASDLDYVRAIRDEFKARLALEKAEAAAKAHREEEEKKSRRPRVGEVWQSDYGMDHLVARVSYNTALLISVCNANRKNERTLELDGNNSVPNDQNLTFVAASLEEYFKAKLLKS